MQPDRRWGMNGPLYWARYLMERSEISEYEKSLILQSVNTVDYVTGREGESAQRYCFLLPLPDLDQQASYRRIPVRERDAITAWREKGLYRKDWDLTLALRVLCLMGLQANRAIGVLRFGDIVHQLKTFEREAIIS